MDFFQQLVEEEDFHVKADKLLSFTKIYLQSPHHDENDTEVFHNILKTLPDLFASFMKFTCASKDFKNVQDQKLTSLESSMKCLECLILYLKDDLIIYNFPIILQIASRILYLSYVHCEESELLYGDSCADFTDNLAKFYNKVQDVQNIVFLQLDGLALIKNSKIDEVCIVAISKELVSTCSMIFKLDLITAAIVWKAFIKFISHFQSSIRSSLDLGIILEKMSLCCCDILKKFTSMVQDNEVLNELEIKVFTLMVKLLVRFYAVFSDDLNPKKCIPLINSIILESFYVICYCGILYAPSLIKENEFMHLLIVEVIGSIKHIMSSFYERQLFFLSALELSNISLEKEYQIALILMKMSLMDFDLLKNNHQDKIELLNNFHNILQKNSYEDDLAILYTFLPVSLFSNAVPLFPQLSDFISMYEIITALISTYMKNIQDNHFENYEIKNQDILFSTSNVGFLIFIDSFTFRLRFSAVEFVYSHVISMWKLFLLSDLNLRWKLILMRVFKFLPIQYKNEVLKECENFEVLVFGLDAKRCHENLGIDKKVSKVVNYLTFATSDETVQKMHFALQLCSHLLKSSQNADVLKFIDFARHAFKSDVFEIHMSVLNFLMAFSVKCLEKDSLLEIIILKLASLLAETLTSKNYIVRYEALHTYAAVAQSTPHPKIFQETISKCPHLPKNIKSYFLKVPGDGFFTEKDRAEKLRKQIVIFKNIYMNE